MSQPSREHQELIAKANAAVEGAREEAAHDPLRPIYHLTTAANWINDPNGPIQYKGEYHVFFQHNPYAPDWGPMHWGHAKSRDLAHWEHMPIALAPVPGECDKDGVWSGCCVVHDGVPTIIYTGVHPEVQCIARSRDGMSTWTKYEGNPVIGERPRDDLAGFRDPFAWNEGDTWYMVLGSGIKGQGGTALLYRSKDLVDWQYIGPLCIDFAENWECPNFFPLGDKHVLVVSPHGDVKYSVGEYKRRKFTRGTWYPMDLGGSDVFYAPNSLEDDKGRRIMWGWIKGGGTEGYPWNGCLTLPRVLTLRPDGTLGMESAPELAKLRGRHYRFENVMLGRSPYVLQEIQGDCLEVLVEFEPGDATSFGIEVRRSPEGEEKTAITYDIAAKRLICGDKGGEFQLLTDEETLRLHIFLDKSVIEVYANGRACLTARVYPQRDDCLGLSLFANGGSAKIRSADVWEMNSIWSSGG